MKNNVVKKVVLAVIIVVAILVLLYVGQEIAVRFFGFKMPSLSESKQVDSNKIEFSDHPTGQDIAFWHGVLFFADKIDFLQQEFYIYRKRPGSAITSTKKRNLIYLFDQIDRTEKTLKRAGVFDYFLDNNGNFRIWKQKQRSVIDDSWI